MADRWTIGLVGCPAQASQHFVQSLLKSLSHYSLGERQFLISPRVEDVLKRSKEIYVPDVEVFDSGALGSCSGILLVTEGASVDQELHTMSTNLSETQTIGVIEMSEPEDDNNTTVRDACWSARVEYTKFGKRDHNSAAAALIVSVNKIAEKLQLQDDFFQGVREPTFIHTLSNAYRPNQATGVISVVRQDEQDFTDQRRYTDPRKWAWLRVFCCCM